MIGRAIGLETLDVDLLPFPLNSASPRSAASGSKSTPGRGSGAGNAS